MKNIARFLLIIFVAVISIYFVIRNKNDSFESFQESYHDIATRPTGESIQKLISLAPDKVVGSVNIQNDSLVPNDNTIQSQIIREIYYTVFKRFPTRDEIIFYQDYIGNYDITKSQLTEIIKSSADELVNGVAKTKDIIYGTEDDVVVIFNEILMRNPNSDELTRYSKMIASDTHFNKEKLRQLLYNTQEYNRMEMTQINDYNSELLGGITDRQLSLTVQTYYKDVTGLDELDDDTLKFFKKKFVELDLNEISFKNLIVNISNNNNISKTIYNFPTISEKSGSHTTGENKILSSTSKSGINNTTGENKILSSTSKSGINNTTGENKILSSTSKEIINNTTGENKILSSTSKEGINNTTGEKKFLSTNISEKKTPSLIAGENNNKKINQEQTKTNNIINIYTGNPNQEIIQKLLGLFSYDKDGQYIDSKNIINAIQTNINDNNTNTSKNLNPGNDQSFAKLSQDRNIDLLENTCERNKKFLEIDQYGSNDYKKFTNDDLVLDPSQKWSIPQKRSAVCYGNNIPYKPEISQSSLIGTLLPNAFHTKIGSIMPLYPPKTKNNI